MNAIDLLEVVGESLLLDAEAHVARDGNAEKRRRGGGERGREGEAGQERDAMREVSDVDRGESACCSSEARRTNEGMHPFPPCGRRSRSDAWGGESAAPSVCARACVCVCAYQFFPVIATRPLPLYAMID